MIKVGHWNDRADNFLVYFVFFCIAIIIVLLFVTYKAEVTAHNIISITNFDY